MRVQQRLVALILAQDNDRSAEKHNGYQFQSADIPYSWVVGDHMHVFSLIIF